MTALAQALFRLTFRGGGIGANIHNLMTITNNVDINEVNGNIDADAFLEELNQVV